MSHKTPGAAQEVGNSFHCSPVFESVTSGRKRCNRVSLLGTKGTRVSQSV